MARVKTRKAPEEYQNAYWSATELPPEESPAMCLLFRMMRLVTVDYQKFSDYSSGE